ncbi:hypothetical protein MPTK1_1g28260 [Marchantia polymorpha subsp. ruderalis]|uniref:Uncharacterized protein n=2 Tax=Marchantia polymorpha TaxID=3197 RepID=A0AAF6AV61_MARPO|nr:hypothetical protein MARPO_0002s0052 [Marchantia polymorpha]BBN00332.1 hypothetical protein Mp_1g28260 [Marchantia polymorpha subsp. ruderalis]|eukprot:PTQ49550.1 hypothetical protein MARPO_0002s0052 [Marchantia polymorpha]
MDSGMCLECSDALVYLRVEICRLGLPCTVSSRDPGQGENMADLTMVIRNHRQVHNLCPNYVNADFCMTITCTLMTHRWWEYLQISLHSPFWRTGM